jgi:hypothetical protein
VILERLLVRGALAAMLVSIASSGFACALEQGTRIELNDRLTLDYRVEQRPIEVARHFALLLLFCRDRAPVAVDGLRVDATMPAHGHGMNYRAEVGPRPGGGYRVEGLLFHMPGAWQVTVDFTLDGRRHKVPVDFPL